MVIIPHVHARAGGYYVTWAGVHVCLWTPKNFESYFSDLLTFSNIRGRSSHRKWALALFVRMDDIITHTNTSVSIVI